MKARLRTIPRPKFLKEVATPRILKFRVSWRTLQCLDALCVKDAEKSRTQHEARKVKDFRHLTNILKKLSRLSISQPIIRRLSRARKRGSKL